MSKFVFSSKIIPNKNPANNLKYTTITAKSDKNLITLPELHKFVDRFKKEGVNIDDMKIIVANRERTFWTIKTTGEVYDTRYDGSEQENGEKLNQYYSVTFIGKE